tara:strand:- start:162 stop:488 length:327 start_codon:yes stop_codon:yes gene_type:complete
MDWMKNAWDWTSNLLGDTDMGDLIDGAKFATSYFDDDAKAGDTGRAQGLVNLSGKIKTSMSSPRTATANKISKSPITSSGEATLNKHRVILARAISQARGITATAKRT